MTVKFKSVLNGDSNAFKQVPAKVLKYLSGTKSLYQPVSVLYDFACFFNILIKNQDPVTTFSCVIHC